MAHGDCSVGNWEYRHPVKENPKDGYTIDQQPCSCKPRSVRVNEHIENVEDLCSVKTPRSICEISRETGIHRLTVHRIIHRDVQLNCVKELMRKEILKYRAYGN